MLPLLLKYIGPRDGVIGVLLICLLWIVTLWHGATVDLKKARLVYEHPAIKTVDKIVYRQGPVRIKTVVVKEKDGSETTTIDEERDPVTTDTTSATESAPVPLSVALAPPRVNQWLAGLDLRNLDYSSPNGYTAYGGYSFKNRVDLLAGIGKHDHWESHLMIVARF